MSSKKVAISQSNYIPWIGYFDLLGSVDTFVIYDDVQFTRRDWRNRNRIKTPQGPRWLTIPIESKGNYFSKISDMQVSDSNWAEKHWKTLEHNYAKAPRFAEVQEWLKGAYETVSSRNLSAINQHFLERILEKLGISTEILLSSSFQLPEDRNERLLTICKYVGATEYVSGPAAKSYLNEDVFDSARIRVNWFEYANYPEYQQLWGDFEPNLSIVDFIFNVTKIDVWARK
ncbi:WbqC family protein [Pontimonas sp.]|nr:WbqC family protein [Pontimonas sp.]